jgi:SAM-dependent methyltransferase
MDEVGSVRDAYSSMSHQYIGLFDGPAAGGQAHAGDESLIRRHLGGLAGPVFDLGCGPGHWSAYLHSLGDEVTSVDVVPEFIAHAQATHPGPTFRLGSMTALDVAEHSASGVLSWYSTIHLPPTKLDDTLAGIRRLLAPCGVLVIGFFDSDDEVAEFEHAVTTAYRWPFDVFNQHLAAAGFTELERLRFQVAERPNRKYAAIAARAS